MPDKSILDAVAEQVGTAVFPIPLNACRVTRPYLLERAGIPADATVLFFSVPYLIAADARAPERNLSLYAVPSLHSGAVGSGAPSPARTVPGHPVRTVFRPLPARGR